MAKTTFQLKPIVPNIKVKPKDWLAAYEKAVDKTAKLIERDLKATVKTWDTVVRFRVERVNTSTGIGLQAVTDNLIYHFVNVGTKPHVIRAKNAPLLRFQTGYKAKTRVGIIGSRSGGASGAWAQAEEVKHPGTDARDFTGLIRKRRQKTLEQETRQELAKIARKQG